MVRTGCSIARLRNPKKAPTKVKGTDTQNHRANKATKVKKGIAADEPSYLKMNNRKNKLRFVDCRRGEIRRWKFVLHKTVLI